MFANLFIAGMMQYTNHLCCRRYPTLRFYKTTIFVLGYRLVTNTESYRSEKYPLQFIENNGTNQKMNPSGTSPSENSAIALRNTLRQARNIIDVLACHAAERPDQKFVTIDAGGDEHVTSFSELHKKSKRYGSYFVARGVQPGDHVAAFFTTHPEQAPVFFGAIMAGAVPFLLPTITQKQDPAIFWQAQLAALQRTQVRLIVTEPGVKAMLAQHAAFLTEQVVEIDGIVMEEVAHPLPGSTAQRTQPAFLQHSSGTTGTKKGVILTHGMVLDFVAALGDALEIVPGDVIASWLPLYHDMGLVGCLVLPMLLGITTVHTNPFDWVVQPASLFDIIEKHKATLCWQPNFAFQHLVRSAPRGRKWDLSSIRAFIDCSEPCKPDTIQAFLKRFGADGIRPEAMQASYGMAENVFIATQTRMAVAPRVLKADLELLQRNIVAPVHDDSPGLAFLSTGFPIPGTRIRILDDAGADLPERAVGQISVTSPYLFSAYHGSDLAQTKLVEGWYLTGDYGFMDAGELFVCGRRDELLIINGKNIYATDVEFAVNNALKVKPGRCVTVGPYNPRTGSQSLVVIAESEDEASEARQRLAREIKTLVYAEFGIVPHDVFVAAPGWVSKSTSGKISRGANEHRYIAERWS